MPLCIGCPGASVHQCWVPHLARCLVLRVPGGLRAWAASCDSFWLVPVFDGVWTSAGSWSFPSLAWLESRALPVARSRSISFDARLRDDSESQPVRRERHAKVAHHLRGRESNKALRDQRGCRLRRSTDLILEFSVGSRLPLLGDLEDNFAELHAQFPRRKVVKSLRHRDNDAETTPRQAGSETVTIPRRPAKRTQELLPPRHVDIAQSATRERCTWHQALSHPGPLSTRHRAPSHPGTLKHQKAPGPLAPWHSKHRAPGHACTVAL